MAVAAISAWAKPALPATIAPARKSSRFKVILVLLLSNGLVTPRLTGGSQISDHWLREGFLTVQ
jgi:hypothetical protein